MYQWAVLTCVLLHQGQAALPLPSYVKPCARTDPNFNKCALEHGREALLGVMDGDRKYKVPPLDPLFIKEIKVAEGSRAPAGISLNIRDAKVHGMRNSELQKTEYDFDKKHIEFEMLLPRVEIIGKYEAKGRVLLLPISGNGDTNITMVNAKVKYSMDYTLEPRSDGSIYMAINNNTPKSVVTPKRIYLHLDNLFNGDKLLGKQMNIFLDENWQQVYEELSPAMQATFTEVVTTIIDSLCRAVPFDVAYPLQLPP